MPDTPAPSGTIDRFRLEALLGRGAMGEVWRAVDPAIDRRVAIKAVRLDSPLFGGTAGELLTRFRQEARSAGRLKHPNVVAIYDYGEEDGLYYLVMEYVEGTTLAERIDSGGAMPSGEASETILQACSALDAAHRKGIVHRDIKPANLMIERETGLLKVLDFGIARLETDQMTRTGTVFGTPSYMSPEQVLGRAIDHRTDLFSLGAVYHELLTGRRAFPGDHMATIAYRIVNEEPDGFPDLPARLGAGYGHVLGRALAKDPDGRFRSAEEMAEAIRRFALDGAAPPERPRTPPVVSRPVAVPLASESSVAPPNVPDPIGRSPADRAFPRRSSGRVAALATALAVALLAGAVALWTYVGGDEGRTPWSAGAGAAGGAVTGPAVSSARGWSPAPVGATEPRSEDGSAPSPPAEVPPEGFPDPRLEEIPFELSREGDLKSAGEPIEELDALVEGLIVDEGGSEVIVDLEGLYEDFAELVGAGEIPEDRSGPALSRFDRSPGRGIPGNDRVRLFGITLEQCARVCLTRDGSDAAWTCRSFQYAVSPPEASGSRCEIGERSRTTHTLEARPGFDHFERLLP